MCIIKGPQRVMIAWIGPWDVDRCDVMNSFACLHLIYLTIITSLAGIARADHYYLLLGHQTKTELAVVRI